MMEECRLLHPISHANCLFNKRLYKKKILFSSTVPSFDCTHSKVRLFSYSDTVCLFKYVMRACRRFLMFFWSSKVQPKTAASNFLSTIGSMSVALDWSSCTLHAFKNVWHRWRANARSPIVSSESIKLFTWCKASSWAASRTVFTLISTVDKRLLIRCE